MPGPRIALNLLVRLAFWIMEKEGCMLQSCSTYPCGGTLQSVHGSLDAAPARHACSGRLYEVLGIPPTLTRSLCVHRVHFPRLECRTDATHVLRCALGTGVRVLNWCLAASAGFSALCLAAGISRSALVCRMLEVRHSFPGSPFHCQLCWQAEGSLLMTSEACHCCYCPDAPCACPI